MFTNFYEKITEILYETKNKFYFYRDKSLKIIGVSIGFFVTVLFMKKYCNHIIPKNFNKLSF
jgi:hypothetical protein